MTSRGPRQRYLRLSEAVDRPSITRWTRLIRSSSQTAVYVASPKSMSPVELLSSSSVLADLARAGAATARVGALFSTYKRSVILFAVSNV